MAGREWAGIKLPISAGMGKDVAYGNFDLARWMSVMSLLSSIDLQNINEERGLICLRRKFGQSVATIWMALPKADGRCAFHASWIPGPGVVNGSFKVDVI